jgi:hypothetical protein
MACNAYLTLMNLSCVDSMETRIRAIERDLVSLQVGGVCIHQTGVRASLTTVRRATNVGSRTFLSQVNTARMHMTPSQLAVGVDAMFRTVAKRFSLVFARCRCS